MGKTTDPVFYCSYNLKTLNIGESVKNVPDLAFSGCTGLTSVTIGSNVTCIGSNAFDGCDKIENVFTYSIIPPTISFTTFTAYVNDNAILHTVKGYKDEYAEAPYWGQFDYITDDLAGVEGVKADNTFNLTVVGGTLTITGIANDAVVNIYNTNGTLLHHTTALQASSITLSNGIYLVQVNGLTKKVIL